MFAFFTGLFSDGTRGLSLMIKTSYLCERANLKPFSQLTGAGGIVEKIVMGIIKPIGYINGWNKLLAKYMIKGDHQF